MKNIPVKKILSNAAEVFLTVTCFYCMVVVPGTPWANLAWFVQVGLHGFVLAIELLILWGLIHGWDDLNPVAETIAKAAYGPFGIFELFCSVAAVAFAAAMGWYAFAVLMIATRVGTYAIAVVHAWVAEWEREANEAFQERVDYHEKVVREYREREAAEQVRKSEAEFHQAVDPVAPDVASAWREAGIPDHGVPLAEAFAERGFIKRPGAEGPTA